ncbi:helix-turn-helix transcriptional regulator [Kitasatospora sp. NPDC049258]|uniref:helix-turn-helix domain-containing protein n=1 Tax=Kitasatospora sp. NPDC049258 TaxID=3155394 RepID=UPI0034341691
MDTGQAPHHHDPIGPDPIGHDPIGGNPIGDYLRARRGQLTAAPTAFAGTGYRRVPGLRREEVALLAGVSTDYYTRLEQGRERNPSEQILQALGRALELDEEAVAHLVRIARPAARRTRRPPAERVAPALRQLLDGLAGSPALVLGHALDVLALNPLAAALYEGFERVDNLARMTFLDPAARSFHRDHDRAARASVAALRVAAGRHAGSARLTGLVGELSIKSHEFRILWARHEVRGKAREAKLLHHPRIGELDLHYETFTVNAAPGQQLVVYQAEPGTPSADGVALLAALTAGAAPTPKLLS